MRLAGIDRGRYAERAALICSALLALAALWLLVRLVWLLVPRGAAALDVAPARAGTAAAGAVPAQSIAKWHLFGDTPIKRNAGRNAPATTLSLILRGTVAENDPKSGVAVISDPQNGERAFRVGEEVASGARLDAIYPDHVVLVHEGAEEVLNLPRDRNLAPGDIVRPVPATASSRSNPLAAASSAPVASDAAAPVQRVKAPADWQQTVARLRQNPDELAKRVQIVPVLEGGKLSGVRVSAGADAALLSQIGLRAGDVITSVNGLPVDSFARGEQILAGLKNSASVRVTVQRDGKPVDLSVGLQ